MSYEVVIGIETHVELSTRSKMFCGCAVDFGADPNTRICPTCLGLPGAMPAPNRAAIESIVAIGAALGCTIVDHSVFHRKNYFYPDLPKNYQISQYDLPICVGGALEIDVDGEERRVGITRVHMEEDTGKSLHVGGGGRIGEAGDTLLDFNRSGVPLVEIVSEPDIRSPIEGRRYAEELQALVRALGVSDAKLEEGSMRFDVNISLRPAGSSGLGTRAEIKNVNSLRSLERAIEYEISRQGEILDVGEPVVQETRHWDEEGELTRAMRGKEESSDYRYFPEPDLVPLAMDDEWRARAAAAVPELPRARRARLQSLGMEEAAARQLAGDPELTALFDGAVAAGADPRTTANWLTGEVVALLRRDGRTLDDTPLAPAHLAELSEMMAGGRLSATAAKEVLAGVLAGEGDPAQVAEARDLIQLTDAGELEKAVDAVLAENGSAVAKLAEGDRKVIGFLVGQVMRLTGGKADPRRVTEIIERRTGGLGS